MLLMRLCVHAQNNGRAAVGSYACRACPTMSMKPDNLDTCFECAISEQRGAGGQCEACPPGQERPLGQLACEACTTGKKKGVGDELCQTCSAVSSISVTPPNHTSA